MRIIRVMVTIAVVGLTSATALAHEAMQHAFGPAGEPGDPSKVSRTIEITMADNMRFTPSFVRVKRGETVRFLVSNQGKLEHELVIGTLKELKEHAAMMREMPEMAHSDENMVTVKPISYGGSRAEDPWTSPASFRAISRPG